MSISIKKSVINGKTYSVVTTDEFEKMDDSLKGDDIAIIKDGYLYPYVKTIKNEPSCYSDSFMFYMNKPKTKKEKKEYSTSKIIDFSNIKDFKGLLNNVYELQKDKRMSLISTSNTFTIPISEEDEPQLKILKKAINLKHIDNDAYKNKFPSPSDFNNDTRALTSPDNHTTSFYKLVRDLNAYDLEGELIIRDQPGAVNPMGTELRILLTERRPADTISVSDNDKQESEEK